MPLCRRHHRMQHDIGIGTFAFQYIQVRNYLTAHGWSVVEEFGVKKVRKT